VNRARRPRAAAGSFALAGLAAAVIIGAAGCASSPPVVAQGPTAKMERVGNSLSVVLTPLGAARIGVQTTVATTAATSPSAGAGAGATSTSATAGAADIVVPYAALLYEPDGSAAVYVNTGPLVYTRYLVPVDFISGNDVYLKPGSLPPRAKVVTTGAEELLGVQNGVGEET
jgi:hypothetical protein